MASIAAGAATGAGCFAASLLVVQTLFADSERTLEQTKRRRSRRHSRKERQPELETSSDEDCSRAKRDVVLPQRQPMEAGWQGFSMAEARQLADAGHDEAIKKTPQEVLAQLQKGNMRFWTSTAHRPERSAFERRALISKQFPSVAILSCADSRVPAEIVFDVGLGDMFVVRVAGNCLDTASLASLQYAINHLKVKVVVVMGHEACGAVKAAGLPSAQISKEPQALGRLLNNLKGGLDHNRLENIHDSRAYDREAVVTNVRRQIEQLAADDGIMAKVASKDLLCVGAFYEISSGIVDFFSEVSVETPDKDSKAEPVKSPSSLVKTNSCLAPGVTRGVASRLPTTQPVKTITLNK
eukprot:TRINITY_DN303_c1_g1_i1.p1 TRINITY_DN303_c1_g1~~TRINITY_DN303_c1_g1_i1.p1  ORF type:complete len:354 (+),score=73.22 TRINITY_DN303_c1_g1_i1:85-1146(+)